MVFMRITREVWRTAMAIVVFLGLQGLGQPIRPVRAADGIETTPVPIDVLFHTDFTTRADRWRLTGDQSKGTIDYDESSLRFTTKAANYALWSVPDSDLKPDQFDMRVTGSWTTGANDAALGIILSYQSDNDMLLMTVSRAGQVRVGNLRFSKFSDLSKPVKLSLDATEPVQMRAVLSVLNGKRTLQIFVNDLQAQTIVLTAFKASTFGVYASSGTSQGLNAGFQLFSVSVPQ